MSRRVRRLLVLANVLAALLLAASLWLFVFPSASRPSTADAVVVLSGDRGERLAEALALLDRGVASTLVHVGTPDSTEVLRLCRGTGRVRAVCLRPEPDNTATEGRVLGRLARERGWRRLVVVTSTYHVTRAGLMVRRCFDGEVEMVAADPDIGVGEWIGQVVHEWGGMAEAVVLRRECGG